MLKLPVLKFTIEFLILGFLVFLSGFFSVSEASFMTVNKLKIRHLANKGSKNARILWELLRNPGRFLTAILVGNNLVNVAASSLATLLAIDLLSAVGLKNFSLAGGLATGMTTFVILVFGEITPKTWAIHYAERLALALATVFKFYIGIIDPIIPFFVAISNAILHFFGLKTTPQNFYVTEEEIRTLISLGREEGVIEEEEKEMIHGVFDFTDMVVRQVMIPRKDMICVDGKTPVGEVIETILQEGPSRIPIYDDKIDNIMGIVYAKDFLKLSPDDKKRPVKDYKRPAVFIPETKKVSDLLKQMRTAQTHIAIVLNENGETSGLVTMEDLIEEIIGEIQDEYD